MPTACHEECLKGELQGTGKCRTDGLCDCWWGWTGPGAQWNSTNLTLGGMITNRIHALHCSESCHYTHDFRNHNCLLPVQGSPIGPNQNAIPCNDKCTNDIYPSRSECLPTGRCLCWWGWAGPNGQYRDDKRLEADYCTKACHYTHVISPQKCLTIIDN